MKIIAFVALAALVTAQRRPPVYGAPMAMPRAPMAMPRAPMAMPRAPMVTPRASMYMPTAPVHVERLTLSPVSGAPEPHAALPATDSGSRSHGGGDGLDNRAGGDFATGHEAETTDKAHAWEEARHGLRQSQFDLDYIDRYNQGQQISLLQAVDPAEFNTKQYKDIEKWSSLDSYNVVYDKLTDALRHARNAPHESRDRHTIRNLRLQRRSAELNRQKKQGYFLGTEEINDFIDIQKAENEELRARLNFRETMRKYRLGEADEDAVEKATYNLDKKERTLEAENWSLLGHGDLADYSYYEMSEVSLERAERSEDKAYRAFRADRNPTTRRELELAEIATESSELRRLASLAVVTGNPILEEYAWGQAGMLDEDYYDIVDEHLSNDFRQTFHQGVGNRYEDAENNWGFGGGYRGQQRRGRGGGW